jgi:predicted dehydrogenase
MDIAWRELSGKAKDPFLSYNVGMLLTGLVAKGPSGRTVVRRVLHGIEFDLPAGPTKPAGVLTLYPAFWDRPTTLVPWVELYTEEAHAVESFAVGPVDYFVAEIRDFVQRLQQGGEPAVSVEDGYWVDRLIHLIYQAADQRQKADS